MVYTHTVDRRFHAAFLNQGRHDPITGEKLKHGDTVVFCAVCKSAFLKDSWEYSEGHCDQNNTLSQFPSLESMSMRRFHETNETHSAQENAVNSALRQGEEILRDLNSVQIERGNVTFHESSPSQNNGSHQGSFFKKALRIVCAFTLPPLAVLDRGVIFFALVTALTVFVGWIPGIIAALLIIFGTNKDG